MLSKAIQVQKIKKIKIIRNVVYKAKGSKKTHLKRDPMEQVDVKDSIDDIERATVVGVKVVMQC